MRSSRRRSAASGAMTDAASATTAASCAEPAKMSADQSRICQSPLTQRCLRRLYALK